MDGSGPERLRFIDDAIAADAQQPALARSPEPDVAFAVLDDAVDLAVPGGQWEVDEFFRA